MTETGRINAALQYARNKNYDKAIQEYTSLLTQDRSNIKILLHRGCAYLHLGQYQKAIDDFTSTLSSSNLSSQHKLLALYKRGYAYYKINRFDAALDDYRSYLNQCTIEKEQNRLRHKGLFQIAIIYATLHNNNDAISYFTDAIKSSRNTEEDGQKLYYLHRGRAYACIAKYDEAQNDFELVLKHSNDSFIKGCAYNELGQHEKATKEFDALLESTENQSKLPETYYDHILFRQGLSYASLNSHDKALTYFDRGLTHSEQQSSSPITDRILFRKGMSYMTLGLPHQALSEFNKSTKLNENQSDVFYARGMLHYTLGRHDAAVHDKRKAMELGMKSGQVPETIHHTHQHLSNYNQYFYYANKIQEADRLLKECKDPRSISINLHGKVRYLHKQASYSIDPSEQYETAHNDLGTARRHLKADRPNDGELKEVLEKLLEENSVILALNNFLRANYLADKYATAPMPQTIVKQYIYSMAESIKSMSELFNQYILKGSWNDLIKTLKNELRTGNIHNTSKNDIRSITYINDQLERIEKLQETMKLFADSPAQQEFYGLLVNRLWNIFDAVRSASTGIFSHALEGNLTKVSSTIQLLGQVISLTPIGGDAAEKVSGFAAERIKQLDQKRIQNALNFIGNVFNPTITKEISNNIAVEITTIYENQIKRFPTAHEEQDIANENKNEQQTDDTCCSKCATCWSKCCGCLKKQRDAILNDRELTTMETIVAYGTTLALSCLIRFDANDTREVDRIQNVFIHAICRPPKDTFFHMLTLADKIKPKDAQNDKDRWDTFDFFRRPPIEFENGKILARKQGDTEKYGCRKATLEEKQLFKEDPKQFDELGFKITIENPNLS